jgi:hypothetical protein
MEMPVYIYTVENSTKHFTARQQDKRNPSCHFNDKNQHFYVVDSDIGNSAIKIHSLSHCQDKTFTSCVEEDFVPTFRTSMVFFYLQGQELDRKDS